MTQCDLCNGYAGSTIFYRHDDDIVCTRCAASINVGPCKACSRPVTLASSDAGFARHVACPAPVTATPNPWRTTA